MAQVLAFGDSLTWGHRPDGMGRHPAPCRWPEVLAAGLDGVTVIPEGLRGRCTAYDDPSSPADLNGARILPTLLHSHAPLDLVIVMLGTNDVCRGHGALGAERGLRRLVEIIRTHPVRVPEPVMPQVLLVAPPPVIAGVDPDLNEDVAAQARDLTDRVARIARERGTAFFDAGTVAAASLVDGVHFDADVSRALGLALVAPVAALLGRGA